MKAIDTKTVRAVAGTLPAACTAPDDGDSERDPLDDNIFHGDNPTTTH